MQTIAQFIEKHGLIFSVSLVSSPVVKNIKEHRDVNVDGWRSLAFEWRVTITEGERFHPVRKTYTLPYWMGSKHVKDTVPVKPTLESVLDSLKLDVSCIGFDGHSVQTFEAFAAEAGYDTDSRKAEATYKECVDEARKLYDFLGRDAYMELMNETEWD